MSCGFLLELGTCIYPHYYILTIISSLLYPHYHSRPEDGPWNLTPNDTRWQQHASSPSKLVSGNHRFKMSTPSVKAHPIALCPLDFPWQTLSCIGLSAVLLPRLLRLHRCLHYDKSIWEYLGDQDKLGPHCRQVCALAPFTETMCLYCLYRSSSFYDNFKAALSGLFDFFVLCSQVLFISALSLGSNRHMARFLHVLLSLYSHSSQDHDGA